MLNHTRIWYNVLHAVFWRTYFMRGRLGVTVSLTPSYTVSTETTSHLYSHGKPGSS